MIIGREKEQKKLLSAEQSSKSEFVAVFGRRRVGKTYLIRETFKDRFCFYHTGLANACMARQLSEFKKTLCRYCDQKFRTPKDWFEALDFLRDVIEVGEPGKKIVFLDELPWMDTAKSSFVSALEHFWNGWASGRDDVVLIVCGSATSWIVNKVLNDHGGLHNRVTKRIPLRPFSLSECEKFVRQKGVVLKRLQLLEYYMIFGGIPYYWEQLEKGESVSQCVDRVLFDEEGELHHEFDRLYASLFRKPASYISIVTALGMRKIGMTREELAKSARQKLNGRFSERLLELEQCGFLRKYAPPGHLTRDSVYQLIDNFTLFYFKFMQGRSTAADEWAHVSNSQSGRIWCGLAFERVCLQHVEQIKSALGIADVRTEAYGWRMSSDAGGAQIDLVLVRDDRVVNLCEMKYTNGEYVIDEDYERRLRNKVDAYQRETGTADTILLTMVTARGLKANAYSSCVQKELVAEDLFRE